MRNSRFIKVARKSAIMCGIVLMLLGAITQPGMKSYAAETQIIVSYGQSQVKILGNWEQQIDGRWKFKQFTGSYLTSSWIESQSEPGAWYFVDANGYMLTSTTTPDGYYVDANGVWRATGGSGNNSGSGQQSGESSNQQVVQNNNSGNNGNTQQKNSNSGGTDNTSSGNWWETMVDNGGGFGDIGNNSPSSLNQ